MGFPIKYAVEELKVDGGYVYDYNDITKGFIVSKCYVLERRLSYGDESLKKYVILFPYDKFECFAIWYSNNSNNYNYDIYKHYKENRNNPYSVNIDDPEGYYYSTCELFDTYEEAKEVADYKNGCLRGQILANTGSTQYEKLSKDFEYDMELCGEYEKFVFANTTDMEISLDNRFTYSKDSEVIAKLLEEFQYDPNMVREVISKYEELKNKKLIRKCQIK